MLIKTLIFKNPFEKKYSEPIQLKNLNRINVLIGKNNSGKTTILDHLTTFLSRLDQSNGALSHLSIEISIKELTEILNKFLIPPLQHHGNFQFHSTLDEDKLKSFKDFKSTLEKIEDSPEVNTYIELIFYRNLEEKKIINIEYKVDESKKNSMINSFIEKLTILVEYQMLSLGNLFNYIIQNYKKMYICATRCLDSGEQFTDKPLPNVNSTIRKLFENRISSNSIIDDEDQYKFEIFRIPNLTLILEYIKRGEIHKLDKSFIDKFKKNLKKFFPRYDLSTHLRLNPLETGQQILDEGFDIGGWKGLGHGHQQLISLLFLFALPDNYIYFIDEPEIGLHPGLQTKLLQFIKEEVLNQEIYSKQFFFATHSTSFIDFRGNCSHYICEKTKDKFSIELLEKYNFDTIRDELGLKPSALLQANGIIWVEGTSDTYYIDAFFKCCGIDLNEKGIIVHHLGGKGFVKSKRFSLQKLRKIHRNFAIIIDSDKRSIDAQIEEILLERKLELKRDGHKLWIIEDVCDIEGYIPQKIINDVWGIEESLITQDLKQPYEKLRDYLKRLNDKGMIPGKSHYKKQKVKDAQDICMKIKENKEYCKLIRSNKGLAKNLSKLFKEINKWELGPLSAQLS